MLNPNEQTDGQPPQIGRVTAGLVDWCRRYAWLVVALSVAAAAILGEIVSDRISIDTDTDRLLSEKLPWREREIAFDKEFPQNSNLIAVVIDGSTPEQAESATAALAAKLAAAPDLFTSVVRPDGGPFFDRNGLLLLPIADVQSLADAMIAAQGLLGNIAADPSLRGLTNTLTLALQGVNQGATDRAALAPALTAISGAIEANLNPQSPVLPLSWQSMLTGRKPSSTDLRRFIQAKPVMDFSSLTPGARATDFIRKTAADLGFVPANGVTIHLTGDVPLNDEQFATVTEGLGISMAVALTLVALLLYGALRSVRMAAAILVTLIVGLTGTAAFATIIGPLNLISVAFAILFVGIAVDFGIQFSVRYRAQRNRIDDFAVALKDTGRLVGPALALAALAAASGFFSFLPTAYRGVSELGIIAGVGMVIAVFFNLTLLPALLTLFHLGPEPRPVGFAALAGLDRFLVRRRRPVLAATAVLALGAAALLPGLRFDFNPLNLMDPHAEAVSTILQLMKDPNTTPNTIDVLKPSLDDAVKAADRLGKLPEVSRAVTLASYIPEDQPQKLAILHDAETLIGPTLDPATIMPPPDHEAMRSALATPARGAVRQSRGLSGFHAGPHPVRAAERAYRSAARIAPDPVGDARHAGRSSRRTDPFLDRAQRAGAGGNLSRRQRRRQRRPEAIRHRRHRDRTRRGGNPGIDPGIEPHDRGGFRNGGTARHARDHRSSGGHAAACARRRPGAGAAASGRLVHFGHHGPDRDAAQFRQHHRFAAAAGNRRRVRYLLRDELARRPPQSAAIRHRPRHRVQRAHHHLGVRQPDLIVPPRHVGNGAAVVDRDVLHAVLRLADHAGAAGSAPRAEYCASLTPPAVSAARTAGLVSARSSSR